MADYGRRRSIECIFARLKETFNMTKNRSIGLGEIKMPAYSCILAHLIDFFCKIGGLK